MSESKDTKREYRITLKVSADLHRRTRIKAAETGRFVSDVVREFLEEWTADKREDNP